jgi:hypothetical protein
MAFMLILRAFEQVMVDRFFYLRAVRAIRGVGFGEAKEMLIQRDVAGTKTEDKAGESFG